MKYRICILIAMILLISLAGCAQKMQHPTKPSSEWAVDHKACEKEVRSYMNERPDNVDNSLEMKLIKNCMKEKGWYE